MARFQHLSCFLQPNSFNPIQSNLHNRNPTQPTQPIAVTTHGWKWWRWWRGHQGITRSSNEAKHPPRVSRVAWSICHDSRQNHCSQTVGGEGGGGGEYLVDHPGHAGVHGNQRFAPWERIRCSLAHVCLHPAAPDMSAPSIAAHKYRNKQLGEEQQTLG